VLIHFDGYAIDFTRDHLALVFLMYHVPQYYRNCRLHEHESNVETQVIIFL